MPTTIRAGEKKDMQAVFALIQELALFEKRPNEVHISVADLERDGFVNPPKFSTFVAEENEHIIGMALFYERYSTWKGTALHLEDLIVTQEKRGTGAGKALYTAVLKKAHTQQYGRVGWEVLDWNTAAIDFYKSTGATILKDWFVVQMSPEKLATYLEQPSDENF